MVFVGGILGEEHKVYVRRCRMVGYAVIQDVSDEAREVFRLLRIW
jgi:hypothetical protein